MYAGRRRETEEIALYLKKRGHRVDFYHAGREDFERKRVQDRFFDDSDLMDSIWLLQPMRLGWGLTNPTSGISFIGR